MLVDKKSIVVELEINRNINIIVYYVDVGGFLVFGVCG